MPRAAASRRTCSSPARRVRPSASSPVKPNNVTLGMHLSGVYRRAILGPALGFESYAEEALIEIQIDPGLVSPNRMTGVVGVVAFTHNTKHASKTIDHEVIRMIAAHVLQQSLAGPPQGSVLVLFKGGHVALRGVEDDPGRVETQTCRMRVHPFAGK